jgi:hypothetical protein
MKWECEHCGNELSNLVACGECHPKQMQAVGWCPSCEATAWSKIINKRKGQTPQRQVQPAAGARAVSNYSRRS